MNGIKSWRTGIKRGCRGLLAKFGLLSNYPFFNGFEMREENTKRRRR
jgi:hypothetical protein